MLPDFLSSPKDRTSQILFFCEFMPPYTCTNWTPTARTRHNLLPFLNVDTTQSSFISISRCQLTLRRDQKVQLSSDDRLCCRDHWNRAGSHSPLRVWHRCLFYTLFDTGLTLSQSISLYLFILMCFCHITNELCLFLL